MARRDYNGREEVHSVVIRNPEAYRTGQEVTWCPGCGHTGVLEALCHALSRSGLDPADTVLVTGNGCSSMIGFFVKTFAIHGPYGRALPVALGVKLANPSLNVIVAGGDGDAFAAGMGHLIHIARMNPDLTYLIMDNGCYGLTRGQASPTASLVSSAGAQPLNPLALLITAGATFVAQAYSQDPQLLISLMQQAFNHLGFAVINIISPCSAFNKHPVEPLYGKKMMQIDAASHRIQDRFEALRLALEPDSRLRVGVFYREERSGLNESFMDRRAKDIHEDWMRLEKIIDTMQI